MNNANILFNNVSVVFGKHTAIENINLTISPNTVVTVVGPNGGGKTTLLKVILGLVKPTSGELLINGKDTCSLPPSVIGYVPQIKTLDMSFPALSIELVASGLKNNWVAWLSKDEKKKSLEALEKVGAKHLANRQISKLSGGELQRVFLARSFVRNPEILLLDEPVTGIDFVGENDIHNIIEEYRKESNTTILMVTHDWEAAYHHADKVILINRNLICYESPDHAFSEKNLRMTFSHIGHKHEMIFGVQHHA
ncbi:metal ABC transporter ATP-binding protein [Bacteroidetes/Chlorobi group bacterium ChocPot_Mid]|jgi:zinc transport system ATP-binding protein|nr:MAG: metal ABC transporter ATP-binding protein [Bacteroidetes/Chlorobi group bacterium ChocPot_Mid]